MPPITALDASAMEALRRQRTRQAWRDGVARAFGLSEFEPRNSSWEAWDPTTHWVPDQFSSAYNWRVIRMGCPYMSFKPLGRATYSTVHAAIGTPVQVIQRLLGHSSTTTTLKHYVRILDEAKYQAAQRFGEALEVARRRRLS